MAVTDRARLREAGMGSDDAAVVKFVAALAGAGVDCVQVRDHGADDRALHRLVTAVVAVTRGSGCQVVVNERAHVAWAAGADGVHVRGDGMPAVRLRRAWPATRLIGRSVHAGDAGAVAEGADYVVFGTVFPSASKGPGAPVAGLAALQAWAATSPAPLLAIGGVTLDRFAAVRRAGAMGVAAIDLFVAAYAAGGERLAVTVRAMHAAFSDGEHTA